MVNRWLSRQQVEKTGKPCYLPKQKQVNGEWVWDGNWIGGMEPVCDILLPFTRCKQLGCPVGPKEQPAAYVYKQSEPTQFRYVPFWTRFAEDIDLSKASEGEIKVINLRRGDGVRKIV